ncbi:putative inactive receptor kinase At4g23740 [Silene latifolia]|uniref:putative inactive receptor kinase At4g23740 n=1 Tax=Silene latifolia TaxID=37657 RepID=UPI003D7710C9
MNKFGIIFTSIILLRFTLLHINGEPFEDKQALLDFLQKSSYSRYLNWSPVTPVCTSWTGVTCNDQQTLVVALRLPGFGFRGSIPNNTLGRLTGLQILSLRNNLISGQFPSDFSKLWNLTSLYLQFNRFFGPLPLNFSVWPNLGVINLSNNKFNGSIPRSFSSLIRLTTLDLSSNLFYGEIPDFGSPSLRYLNLSNNHLNGTLPKSLVKFPSSSFSGNNVTVEVAIPPLPSTLSPFSQPVRVHESKKKISETALLGIILGGFALVFVLTAVLVVVLYAKKNGMKQQKEVDEGIKKGKMVTESREEKNGRMTFFEGSKLVFDLEDLLRASAEVLGKGAFGTTYKASLEDSTIVVVKRLKEVSIGKREFEQQMEVVGNIKHENVVALRAYYYSKDEKLMVYDYFNSGSLSTMLHGKRGENPTTLDWETRLNIVIGVAKGLAHIHTYNNGKLVHGNIKSSNIFLNHLNHGCVSDLGLATMVTPSAPQVQRLAGYRAPEVTDPRKSTQASDVFSFGVLILELLTGKYPLEEEVSLVRWVNSVVREEWTGEVFDVELLRCPNVEEEMVTILQLGMACAEKTPERRPKMWEVVRMVDDFRRGFPGTHPSSEVSSPTPASSLSHMGDIGSTSTSVAQ